MESRIAAIAQVINEDYRDKDPLFIGVLNGAFLFAGDLIRKITIDCSVSFVKLSSYKGTASTGKVIELIGLGEELHNRHVIFVDDIVDTGNTANYLIAEATKMKATSVCVAALLTKPSKFGPGTMVRYAGFEVPDYFFTGYGLDYEGLGRNLTDIYKLEK